MQCSQFAICISFASTLRSARVLWFWHIEHITSGAHISIQWWPLLVVTLYIANTSPIHLHLCYNKYLTDIDIQVCISWKNHKKQEFISLEPNTECFRENPRRFDMMIMSGKVKKCTMWMAQHVFHDDDEEGWTGWGVVYELTQVFLYDVESSGLFERFDRF